MAEKMVEVDGKQVPESNMPEHCYFIQGQWYTEKGLPKELETYKRLWENARASQAKADEQAKMQAKENTQKKNTTPSEQPSEQETTVPTVNKPSK
jgi:cbb3-type cytochrome oxidase cytochrome c subunit